MSQFILVSIILVLTCLISESLSESLARGFNEKIKWMNLEDGLAAAKAENKPVMILIHKTWCGACKGLKPNFAASKDIENYSSDMVMVNIQDDEEPTDKKYIPDGGYIPRILFADPKGEILTDVYNINGNKNYKYYYHEPTAIVESMKNAIELFKHKPSGEL